MFMYYRYLLFDMRVSYLGLAGCAVNSVVFLGFFLFYVYLFILLRFV